MSEPAAPEAAPEDAPKSGRKKLILLAVPVVLIAVVAALWFTGILPGLLGMKPKHAAAAGKPGQEAAAPPAEGPPVFVDLPEIITNLNVPGRRQSYLKLHAKLELPHGADPTAIATAMPRILDLFQTYMRDMRPEELRGSEGSWRLREELVSRASIAAAPAHVQDVLFEELIVQ